MIYLDSYMLKREKKAEELANLIFSKEKDKNLFLSRYENINHKK